MREAMLPCLTEEWGNPSSSYRFGAKLKGVMETARAQVAGLLGASPREILLTSCATESNNATIANTTNISFHGIESEALLILLDQEGICASSGSACLADSDEPSHVVKAMKPESAASRQMIRFSLGWENTAGEVRQARNMVARAVAALRS